MARPKKEIDGSKVQQLAEYGLNNTEIAEYFNVSEGTIRNSFYEFLAKGRLNVKTKLRRKQIQVALKGNPALLIWLGKIMLGQKEKIETEGKSELTIIRKIVELGEKKLKTESKKNE
ncbi:MAG: hypothetical protein KKF62_02965 [Bacteroidetes bacterium]|nr:hypothetical protein [Bacteroidota bacterium]MBU1115011.1 hypothetical protein [Bacteroidota bacterium]MBU1799503.1 hypothetical protein [Bacteroidota bacterium]